MCRGTYVPYVLTIILLNYLFIYYIIYLKNCVQFFLLYCNFLFYKTLLLLFSVHKLNIFQVRHFAKKSCKPKIKRTLLTSPMQVKIQFLFRLREHACPETTPPFEALLEKVTQKSCLVAAIFHQNVNINITLYSHICMFKKA